MTYVRTRVFSQSTHARNEPAAHGPFKVLPVQRKPRRRKVTCVQPGGGRGGRAAAAVAAVSPGTWAHCEKKKNQHNGTPHMPLTLHRPGYCCRAEQSSFSSYFVLVARSADAACCGSLRGRSRAKSRAEFSFRIENEARRSAIIRTRYD